MGWVLLRKASATPYGLRDLGLAGILARFAKPHGA